MTKAKKELFFITIILATRTRLASALGNMETFDYMVNSTVYAYNLNITPIWYYFLSDYITMADRLNNYITHHYTKTSYNVLAHQTRKCNNTHCFKYQIHRK